MLVVMLLAVDSRLEVPESLPQGPSDLRKPLRPEDEQRDHENKDEMCGLKNVADHATELSWIPSCGNGVCYGLTVTAVLRLRAGANG